MPLLLLLLMSAVMTGVSADPPLATATCTIRGVCGEVPLRGGRLAIPCAGPLRPEKLKNQTTIEKLKEFCPMFKAEEELCCDDANVESLVANFITARGVLGSCEVCFRNFRDLWCQYTCSPRQSQFLHFPPSSTRKLPSIKGGENMRSVGNGIMADQVVFHVGSSYIRSIFQSCAKVHMGSSPALELVCNMPRNCMRKNPSEECIQTCLNDLGIAQVSKNQPTAVNFVIDKEEINPYALSSEQPLLKCQESTIECAACACSDCFAACPATPQFLKGWEQRWAERKPWTVETKETQKKHPSGRNATQKRAEVEDDEEEAEGVEVTEGSPSSLDEFIFWLGKKSFIFGYPWYGVILFLCGVFVASILIGSLFYCDSRRKTKKDAKHVVKFAGTYWGLRDFLDNLQRGGAKWYCKVAVNKTPWIFWITVLVVLLSCFIGFPMQEWISDPIHVWTHKDSRARVEKAIFDDYFQPFPRFTQVIIRPIQTYARPYQYGHKNYGSVFHHYVLQQAFRLTLKLIELEGRGVDPRTGKNVFLRLSDVCYKMVDDNCFVMSPMSYFQNSRSILDCTDAGCSPELDEYMKEQQRLGKGHGRELAFNSFQHMFPNGTGMLNHLEKLLEASGEGDADDLFEDLDDMKKRRKREVSVHSHHRSRAKRHQHSMEVPINETDPLHEERRNQQAHMELGLTVLKHMMRCIEVPVGSSAYLDMKCGSQMDGAPVPGNLVFGGWYKNAPAGLSEAQKIMHYSDAYVLTIGLDARNKTMAEIWEKDAIEFLKKFSSDYVEVSFITHYSIEDEIEAAAYQDIPIILIGYILMAIYIILGLSQFSADSPKGFLAHTLFHQLLPGSFVSVTIALSVAFVIAVYGMFGVTATLMCLEVQPFLLCAIGVNNIFYFVKTYQRKMYERRQLEAALLSGESALPIKSVESEDESEGVSVSSEDERRCKEMEEMEEVIRRDVLTQTCQRVLPSMFCTAFTECMCFLSLGLSSAPVLKVFSFYASAGVLVNFFFTLTIFVPVFIFSMRQSASPSELCSPVDCVPKEKKELRRRSRRRFDAIRSSRGWMPHLIEKYCAPFLFTKKGRYISIGLQCLMIAASIAFIPLLKIGLDEKMSVPQSSYVHKHLSILPDTLAMSLPVHFVVRSKSARPLDVGDERFVKLFCTARADCDKESLGNLIGHAVRVTQGDLISQPAMNWFDDYRKFRSVSNEKSCCMRDVETGKYCTVEEIKAIGGLEKRTCTPCLSQHNGPFSNMTRDLHHFTTLLPSLDCAMSGGMAHREALKFTEEGEVKAFYMTSFHRPFKNSSDFIEGLRLSRDICQQFNKVLQSHGYDDVECFPYAYYYLFYDQYLYIAVSTTSQLALSAGIAFIALTITTVSPTTATIVAMNTLSSTLMLIAYMVYQGIELNALTIVNLAMSLGIGLEFSVHLCFAYANSGRVDRIGRATDALVNVGSTVFSGIILTKLLGIIVLYNAQSQIFTTYYFKFYLGLLPIGVVHGLVFLPVMLTFWGPDTYLRRYVEQNDKASLTGGDQQGSDEGRADSMSSPRSILMASVPTSKTSSRVPPSYGRMAAAISPATTQMTTHSHGSNGDMNSLGRQRESPCLATAASTIDHEYAPLVVREDSLRSIDGPEAV